MLRKKIILMGCLILSAFAYTETKTTYMIIPSNAEIIDTSESGAKQYLYLLTMDENDSELESAKVTVTKSSFYQDDNPEENHTDLYKLSVTSDTDVKIVVGYKISGKDRYVLLASKEVDGDLLQSNYESIVSTTTSPHEVISMADYSSYEEFPGHIVEDQTTLSLMRAGEKVSKGEYDSGDLPSSESLDDPSNIVDKFYQPPTEGDKITLGEGNKINPTNSWKNYEFTVTDKNGDPVIIMKNEDGVNTEQMNENFVDDNGVIDLKNLDNALEDNMENLTLTADGNIVLFSGEADMGPYRIRVRFKDGENFTFNDSSYFTKQLDFYVMDPTIIYGGTGNEFWLEVDEDGIFFPPGERPEDAPPKTAGPAVYVIESEGLKMDGETGLKSKTEESVKQRISDIDLKILETGMGDFKIKSIDE